jgi:hypothetical protein
MKAKRTGKSAKTEQGILLNVARTIGATLGTLAARAGGESKRSTRPVPVKKSRSKPRKTRNRQSA